MTKQTRPYNFSAGPGVLPEAVLKEAQAEMLDWNGTGMSVMEMSHRSKEFGEIAQSAEKALRQLMEIPDNYKVLFLQGGASGQFAAIPLNLAPMSGSQRAACDYVVTGFWSQKAFEEAGKYSQAALAAQGDGCNIPALDSWKLSPKSCYLHYTDNETIHGVEFDQVPSVDIPLVVDVSSSILSKPIDVSKFALVYAGAQKNFGPAGLTIVIVREDMLGKTSALTPSIFDYSEQAKAESMVNTPPTYSWYIAGLTFKWLLSIGGIKAIQKTNQEKAALLYEAIDGAAHFENRVEKHCRSKMNVPFVFKKEVLEKHPKLEERFLREAKENGLLTLAGHRSVGGMRASIYNAMPVEGVAKLAQFIKDFDRTIN